jgi:hypothetical protein
MLLVVATRYDDVTRRISVIAEYLLQQGHARAIPTIFLFEAKATRQAFREEIRRPFQVIAFFGHGNERGIIAQDQEPFWHEGEVPDFQGSVLVALACRAMLCLEYQVDRLRAKAIVGYRVDLTLPPNGSESFWDCYRRLHVLIPLRLMETADLDRTRDEFYRLATESFEDVYRQGGSLVELISLQQSRDNLLICKGQDTLGGVPRFAGR